MNETDTIVKLLESYEAAGAASRELRSAAIAGDWESFDRAQARCHAIVGLIRAMGPVSALPPPLVRRRHEILTDILADDRAIRDILEPLSRRLGQVMRTPHRAEPAPH